MIELFENGLDVNMQIDGCGTVFHAAKADRLILLDYLIQHGAAIDVKDLNTTHPEVLCKSVLAKNINITQALLKNGVHVDSKDGLGRTALYYAVVEREPDFVKLLLEAGADPEIAPHTRHSFLNKTPYETAVEHGYTQIADLIRPHLNASSEEESIK